MKVLLDACVPRPLRKFLPNHTVCTAQEMSWGKFKNVALLREAETQFEALVTTDQNLRYQQKVVGRKIGILVLPTNDWTVIRHKTNEIAAKLAALKPGDFVELDWS